MLPLAAAMAVLALGTVVDVAGDEGPVRKASIVIYNANEPFDRVAPKKGEVFTDDKGEADFGHLDGIKYQSLKIIVQDGRRRAIGVIYSLGGQFQSQVTIRLLPSKPR